jgi:hypothetical protein
VLIEHKDAHRERSGDHFKRRILRRRTDERESPLSTNGRRKSCCALLKRWISSTKRIFGAKESPAFSTICRISSFPAETAESSWYSAFSALA